ncbi:hypothetical protein CYLTODRAFT_456972 [Cylindrobasidium torrendii FP15055 ss-10]|uniref:F-box domain-containing protein n=1 Tax=Cylindrobasidium torrendii FP15055 ss-10 TaxID=1314674 RepID=A0A0D7B3G1_9AGAR|nr:hypothetical protein CYLTODRAFT_456972 [Cylindrobasidium torrendii FP15055 ss-10]
MALPHTPSLFQLAPKRILSKIAEEFVQLCTDADGTLDIPALHPLAVTCSQMLHHIRPYYFSILHLSDAYPPSSMLAELGTDLSVLAYVQHVIICALSDAAEWQHLQGLSQRFSPDISLTLQDLPLHQAVPAAVRSLCQKAKALTLDNCRVAPTIVQYIGSLQLNALSFVSVDFTSTDGPWGQPIPLPSVKKLCLLPNPAGEQELYKKVHVAHPENLQHLVLSVDWAGFPSWVQRCQNGLQRASLIFRETGIIASTSLQAFHVLEDLTLTIPRERIQSLDLCLPSSVISLSFAFRGAIPTRSDWRRLASVADGHAIRQVAYSVFNSNSFSAATSSRICADMMRYGQGLFSLEASVNSADGTSVLTSLKETNASLQRLVNHHQHKFEQLRATTGISLYEYKRIKDLVICLGCDQPNYQPYR